MASVADFTRKYRQRATRVVRGTAADVSTRVVKRTAVDTGALRASWTPNNGRPVARNQEGGGDQNIAGVANSLQPGDTFSLANGQPYVRRIEYEGHSAQTPNGMVRPTVAEFDAIVDEQVREARRG